MTAMTLIAVAGLAVGEPSFDCDWSVISAADVAWLITATIFVLMMTPGLSFFYGGMVGAKNVISTMLQSFIAMGLISVLWVVIGFSLCFYDTRRQCTGWCNDSVGAVRPVPDEVRHHHPVADHRLVC